MAAHSLPRPPARGHAQGNARGHDPRRHARLVNLDTGQHVDAHGVEHTTSDGDPAIIGPHTIVMAMHMGHDAMRAGDHFRQGTSVAKHLRGKATAPHPNEIARKIGKHMMAREGSAAEEAAETPGEEAAERRAAPSDTEKPRKRPPLPPRKAA